jgi:hypothetical protein
MNSLIISQILKEYNQIPYYLLNDYISINDDRMGRIVSFKLYNKDGEILVDFKEAYRYSPYISSRFRTTNITSLEDFKEKWTYYYNFN